MSQTHLCNDASTYLRSLSYQARLLCHVGHPERAERLARRQLALALAAQSQHAAAEAWLLLAECALLGAGREGVGKAPPRERSKQSVVDSECSDNPCRYEACVLLFVFGADKKIHRSFTEKQQRTVSHQ